MMGEKECVVRNEKAQIVTVAPLEMAFRFLKWQCPDGEYSVVGTNTDCTVIRKDGVLYPSSGMIYGVPIDPRSLKECKQFFEEPTKGTNEADLSE